MKNTPLIVAFVFIVFTIASLSVQKVNAQDTLHFGKTTNEFEFTVPIDYDHAKQINLFAKQVEEDRGTDYFNADLESRNFKDVTNKLVPGKTYLVKIFPILDSVSCIDCLNFLKNQNAFLVGAQGLTLLQFLKKDVFPLDTRIVSLDEKDALYKDKDGKIRVPYIMHLSTDKWWFALGNFNNKLNKKCYLLCFVDK